MARLFKTLTVINYQQLRFLRRFPDPSLKQDPTLLNNPSDTPIHWKPRPGKDESLVITSRKYVATEKKREQQSMSKRLQQDPRHETCTVTDKAGNLVYTKMQNKDTRITKIMANVKTLQKSSGLIMLEGKRLIKEALERGCQMEYLLFSRMTEVEYLKPYLPKVGKLYKMPYKEMQTWSDLTTSPGIVGIFHIPDENAYEPKDPLPLTIICDNIREPNNLGAILRISSAVGCEKVILTKGCVNLWDSKVLRSACGAHFHTKLCKDAEWDKIYASLSENSSVFLADNNLLMFSSDNVTTSIDKLVQEIPILPYSSVNFGTLNNIVLVIGGETEGLSTNSYELARNHNGARLNVPLSNNVESLNSSIALGVIAFEIRRQLNRKG